MYISGNANGEFLAAKDVNLSQEVIFGARISGGSVTLHVWKIVSEGKLSAYNGNDQNIEFGFLISDKDDLSSPRAFKRLDVDFSEGYAEISFYQ